MLLHQVFSLSDVPRIFVLCFLEILLSADNAIVLGVVSRSLPPVLRKRALFLGVFSAFFFRAAALFFLSWLIGSVWIQGVGGIYLLYLSVRYFTKKKKTLSIAPSVSFWKTFLLIEALDLVFAIDSIIAGVAFINADVSKLWIVYLGGILGLAGIRYAAELFAEWTISFPNLEKSAYLMIGWIGTKLLAELVELALPPPLFWGVLIFLFLLGFFGKIR